MSWLERAIDWRRYFEHAKFRDGTRFVHRWITLFGGATADSACRFMRDLDTTMETEHHDGASGWGMFRNDVTTWLAVWVRDHATHEDRGHLMIVAACTERYLRALGTGHASATAPIAARWKTVLDANDAAALRGLIDDARATREMHTAGASGVLELIEASARTIDGAVVEMSRDIRPAQTKRSGVPLRLPIAVTFWIRSGGEETRRFETAPIAIGRAETSDVHIASDFLARHHARIEDSSDGLVIRDLRSDNQTFLAGKAIECEPLQENDVVVLGDTVMFVTRG